jgi:hypothetical protein
VTIQRGVRTVSRAEAGRCLSDAAAACSAAFVAASGPLNCDAIANYVRRAMSARAAQGLPPVIENRETLNHLAVLMGERTSRELRLSA